jgi:hypothetical protein
LLHRLEPTRGILHGHDAGEKLCSSLYITVSIMFGEGTEFGLLSYCSRITQKVIQLSNRHRKPTGFSIPRDRHIRRRLLKIEALECRALMSVDGFASYVDPIWFSQCTNDSAIHAGYTSISTTSSDAQSANGTVDIGTQTNTYDWIVQFNTQSLGAITSISQVSSLLVGSGIDFQVLRGLGLVGQTLVRSTGVSLDTVSSWLANNVNVAGYEQDSVRQFELTPNDPGTSQLYSMNKINA